MTVYVDAAIHDWRGRKWCHLFTDPTEHPLGASHALSELHRFAKELGLKREWFQRPPHASWPHYDITASKRVQAIRLGAVEADKYKTFNAGRAWKIAWSIYA